jgi:hypothetical protein
MTSLERRIARAKLQARGVDPDLEARIRAAEEQPQQQVLGMFDVAEETLIGGPPGTLVRLVIPGRQKTLWCERCTLNKHSGLLMFSAGGCFEREPRLMPLGEDLDGDGLTDCDVYVTVPQRIVGLVIPPGTEIYALEEDAMLQLTRDNFSDVMRVAREITNGATWSGGRRNVLSEDQLRVYVLEALSRVVEAGKAAAEPSEGSSNVTDAVTRPDSP